MGRKAHPTGDTCPWRHRLQEHILTASEPCSTRRRYGTNHTHLLQDHHIPKKCNEKECPFILPLQSSHIFYSDKTYCINASLQIEFDKYNQYRNLTSQRHLFRDKSTSQQPLFVLPTILLGEKFTFCATNICSKVTFIKCQRQYIEDKLQERTPISTNTNTNRQIHLIPILCFTSSEII